MDKQIEEMAKLACSVFDGDCCNCSFRFYMPCPPKSSAERLYNAGYRKIPDGAVVLTGEEYERWQGQTLNIKKIRKETAQAFAERLTAKAFEYEYYLGHFMKIVGIKTINEILKELTGEGNEDKSQEG